MTELKDSLKTSSNTAVGADNISTEMLKHMPEHCLQTILLLEKAYDLVYKDILLIKLLNLGVTGFMLNFIAAFLTNRSFQVRISSTHSHVKHLHNGIPQGSVQSPLLFAVIINDLPTCLTSEVALFADDVCFWETDTDIKVLNKLAQSSLNKINAWCNINGFKMSINKSAALLFTKKRKNKQVSLILNNQTIEVKHQFKYLGIIFQENGLYNAHFRYVHDKCLKRINLLRMLKGTSWGVSKDPLLCIYRALIRPIIEYGMEIYFNSSDSTLKQIEKIQTECLRICAGAMRSTPINCLQVHCNEMSLKLKFEQLCLNFRAYLGTFANHPSSSVI